MPLNMCEDVHKTNKKIKYIMSKEDVKTAQE